MGFFVLSKIGWFFTQPANILFLLLIVGTLLLWTPWKPAARWVISVAAGLAIFAATIPVGPYFSLYLENRFPVPASMPSEIDGIVVLGGAVDQHVTKARGDVSLGGSVERIVKFTSLANAFPNAKLVYTGGSGLVSRQDLKEADFVAPVLQQLGLDPARVVFENQSRNTFENAVFTFELMHPKAGEKWILVTSATHMPRAVGAFRHAGWQHIIPYPTDFQFEGDESFGPPLSLWTGLGGLSAALHELLGLSAYYLTGKSSAFIPAP